MSELGQQKRIIRHHRIRQCVLGTAGRPRLTVFRSLRHIYAQLIDDTQGKTLVAASDWDIEDKKQPPLAIAQLVGQKIAAKAKAKKITTVVFDRAGYQYHGQVASLAEGARQNGLQF